MPKGTIKINEPPPVKQIPPEETDKYLGVKHTILVMSGKGGVGKSTFSVNLAVTIGKERSVGLIDADLNGPDDPMMLGIGREKLSANGNRIVPAVSKFNNVKVVSMAFILPDENTALIWRGALRGRIMHNFLEDTEWTGTDYIIIDFPPGTGDEAITVAQMIPSKIDGVIIVVTPQDVALNDAKKAINFAEQFKMNIIGIVENMSGFACPHCGKITEIFKTGGAEKLANEKGINFLGRIPIFPEIVDFGDSGIPAVTSSENVRKIYEEIGEKLKKIVEK